MREWAPGCDPAPHNAYQEIYIQDPIIVDGRDPVPPRTGWLAGDRDAVSLPEAVPVTTARQNAIKRDGAQAGGGFGLPGEPMA